MAVPAFRAAGNIVASSHDLFMTEPAGSAEGDLMVVQVVYYAADNLTGYVNAPAGWTQVPDVDRRYHTVTSGYAEQDLYWMFRGASAPDLQFDVRGGGSAPNLGAAVPYAISGVDPSTANPFADITITSQITGGTADPVTIPGVTASYDDSLVCFFVAMVARESRVQNLVNADLANLAIADYQETAWGNDSAMQLLTGDLATAGVVGSLAADSAAAGGQYWNNFEIGAVTVAIPAQGAVPSVGGNQKKIIIPLYYSH